MAPKIIQAISVDEPDRPLVSITYQGRPKNYEISVREDFSIRQLTRLEQLKNRIDRITHSDGEEVSEEDSQLVADALDEFTRMLIRDCPDEVLDKFNDGHRMQFMLGWNSFMQGEPQTPPAAPNRTARRQTGTKSSRPSSASTEAAQRAG